MDSILVLSVSADIPLGPREDGPMCARWSRDCPPLPGLEDEWLDILTRKQSPPGNYWCYFAHAGW